MTDVSSRARIKTRIHLFCAWSMLFYAAGLIIGWWVIADFMPPIPPTDSGAEVLAIFQSKVTAIRIGMIVVMFASIFYMPLTGIVCYHITRIEGYVGPLTWVQVMGGVCSVMLTYVPAMWWLIGTFRLDRDPTQIQLLNDAGWLNIVGGLSIYLPTLITISIASFIDKSEVPAFPRWFGYMCIWVLLGQLPGQLLFFFKTGPFAWNGLFAFYLPMTVFFVWFVAAFYVMRKATLHYSKQPDWV